MDSSRSDGGLSLTRAVGALLLAGLYSTLLILSRPASAAAQSPDDYWRALGSEREPDILLAVDAPAPLPAPIAEALRLFRVYELTGDEGTARRARELLRRAEVPREYRAWHAIATAIVAARGPDPRMRVGEGRYDWFVDPNSLGSARSLRLLRRVLATAPHSRAAALELAAWAIDRDRPSVAREADDALAGLPEDAEVLLARASLRLLLEDFEGVAALTERAQRLGAAASVARHLLAVALLQEPATTTAGLQAYYDGARVLTDDGRRQYSRALEPLLDSEEIAAWRATPNAEAHDFIARYWRRNAALLGVIPDERLVAHYRRLHRARIDFPSVAPLSALQIQAPHATGDDSRRFGLSLRGFMLVRHGDPYRLAHMEACLSNPWRAPGVGIICPGKPSDRLAAFQEAGRLTASQTFDPFARHIGFGSGVYAFRSASGGAELVFAVSVPARSANALLEGTGEIAGLMSAILLPDSGEPVRRDMVFREPMPPRLDAIAGDFDALALLHTTLDVPLADSSLSYRVTLSDLHRHSGGIVVGEIVLPSLHGLALSDLVLAPVDAEGSWRRGDIAVALAPFRLYAADETFRLYYELYGIGQDAPYLTEVEIAPARRGLLDRLRGLLGADGSVRLRFEGTAPQPHPTYGVQELRTVELGGIEPGLWRLRVVVTDMGTGRRASRETLIDVGPAREAP